MDIGQETGEDDGGRNQGGDDEGRSRSGDLADGPRGTTEPMEVETQG